MEEYPSAPPVSPITKRKPAFWKAGLALFLLVLITLGVLFYFDLPPFKSSKQTPKMSTVPVTSSTTFQYDTAKVKTLLTEYIEETIKPELLPNIFKTKQGITPLQFMQNQSLFVYPFPVKNTNISAYFSFEKDKNTTNYLSISIKLDKLPSLTGSAMANSVLSSYFTKPYTINGCLQLANSTLCEEFKDATDGKRGYGISIIGKAPKSINTVFTCFIPKESKEYADAENCSKF